MSEEKTEGKLTGLWFLCDLHKSAYELAPWPGCIVCALAKSTPTSASVEDIAVKLGEQVEQALNLDLAQDDLRLFEKLAIEALQSALAARAKEQA